MKMKRDPIWRAEVGHRLRLAREALGLKAVKLATSLGISQQRLSNVERGSRPLDMEIAMALSEKHGITMDYLYRGDFRGLPLELATRISERTIPLPAPGRH